MQSQNPFEAIHESIGELKQQNVQLLTILNQLTKPQHSTAPEWLNVEELVSYLPGRPAKATIYQWTHKNLIPFHKQNKKALVFNRAEIDAWIQKDLQYEPTKKG